MEDKKFNLALFVSNFSKHFPADKYVSYEKAKQRVSMVLFSHHFSEKPVRPLVPGLIEIGGIHLNEDPKPLPEVSLSLFQKENPQIDLLIAIFLYSRTLRTLLALLNME